MSAAGDPQHPEIEIYREILDHLEDVVFCHDPDGRFLFLSPAAETLLGYRPEDLPGLTFGRTIPPDYLEEAMQRTERQRRKEPVAQPWELQVFNRQGERVWVQIRTKPSYDAQGRLLRVYGIARDLTARKVVEEKLERYTEQLEAQAEQRTQKLREGEERYRSIVETVPDSIAIARLEDGRLLQVNAYFTQLFGYSREEAVGRTPMELNLYVDPAVRSRFVSELKTRGEVHKVEVQYRTQKGVFIDTLLSARRLTFAGEDCLVAVVTDISHRKQAERELARLATVVEQATEGILITESDGTISYANPAFIALSGFSREEIVGRSIRTMKCDQHDDGFYRTIWNTVTAGRVWKGRIFNQTKEGMLREFESTFSPIRDGSGDIISFVSINRDATQERSLEAQLRQAQKLEAVGTLAGGIAHDFNNILSAIMGYSELAKLDAAGQPGLESHLQEVLKGAKRARDLVKQILTFSRQGRQERKPIDMRLVLKEVLRMLRATLPSTIDIRQNIRAGCGPVEADATQIHQVLMNLCTNSAHAMREQGGVLDIELQPVQLDRSEIQRLPGLRPGPYLKLTVRDSGHGIAPENIERIFDPYFTTKDKGEGTGLGLAMVQGIVKTHNGAITAESRPGEGTAFDVLLPVIEVEPEEEREPSAGLSPWRERVLLVDDENDLVEIGRLMLERLGYSVATRTSSIEALELFKSDPGKFQLVLTDMTMPNMTGDLLAQKLLELRPDLPVILCTGYSERMTEARARQMGIKAFLMKPIIIQDLSTTIRKVLGDK
jgi:PAS domain S-box-containing protein